MIVNEYENIHGEYYTLSSCVGLKGIIDEYGLKEGQEYHKKLLSMIFESIRQEGYEVDVAFNPDEDLEFFSAYIRKGSKTALVSLTFEINYNKSDCNFYGDNSVIEIDPDVEDGNDYINDKQDWIENCSKY